MKDFESNKRSTALSFCFLGLFLSGIFYVLFFHPSDKALFAGDSPPYLLTRLQDSLREGFSNLWLIEPWIGQPYGPISPDHNALLLGYIAFPFKSTVLYAFNLVLAGLGTFWLLRKLSLSNFASIFGGISLALTNGVLTLVLPGHIHKIYSYAWLPFSIAFFLSGLQEKRFSHFLICGGFLGLSVLGGEIQMAYYLGLWFVLWSLIHLFTVEENINGEVINFHVLGLVIIAAVALALGIQKTEYFLSIFKDTPPVVGSGNTDENWQFATQFYFPPEEVLSYITTTQFFGGAEAYWGRDGNPTPLRLTDDYMGLIPLGFAIVAVFTCWRIWQAQLFIVMGIFSLFISFGREGLLYLILYQLPTMKSQRNPHRWSYFVSLAVAVLAAYGINWLITKFQETPVSKKQGKAQVSTDQWILWKRVLIALGSIGILLFFISLILRPQPESLVPFVDSLVTFFHGKEAASAKSVLFLQQAKLMIASLFRTGYFLALSAASVWLLIVLGQKAEWRTPRWKFLIPCCFVLAIMILDLSFNAKRFIQFYPWKDFYEKNELVQYLKNDTEPYRIKVLGLQQNQLLNQLTTFIFPYHRLPVVDPPAASRIPTDYKYFFDYMSDHYVPSNHYFNLFNIKYVMSASPFNDPMLALEPIVQWNGIQVYKRRNAMPRAWLAPKVKVVKGDKDAILFATVHPGRNFYDSVVIEEDPSTSYPELKEYSKQVEINPPPPQDRQAKITVLEDNRVLFDTQAAVPTFLVLSDKWDSNWKAWVDDVPTKMYRANFLIRAVEVPAGNHKVRMEYRPPMTTFWISLASISLFGLFGIGMLIKRSLG